ncbi:tryptophan aminotransferase-related protein 1-like [Silene latifolia]|uniref:tryptophan aminotransferase-related protein 1-like n=1 Tax=Silene latifolia TaxID=37657 RepID=UPI003D77C9E7
MCGVEIKKNGNGNSEINNNSTRNYENGNGITKINGNGNGITSNGVHHSSRQNDDVVINLDQGDPKMYFPYWKNVDDKCTITIKASELMSYFADVSNGGVFYQMPEFTEAVRRVHRVVGNAVADDRYIIGGTGSSQLFTVALKALASTVKSSTTDYENYRIPVVCAEPYYSCYGEALEEGKSEVYKWEGDANKFKVDGPYIEVVTTPNNPDGRCREPVVNKEGGMVICDLAYYWPQYTPITAPADYDVMLFTLSKATGHAGSRVGWAIVKNKEVAMNMIKVMTLETIGTCHEGQLRATKLLDFVADGYDDQLVDDKPDGLFEFGHRVLAERWEKLRAAVESCGAFSLPDFPSDFCNFWGKHCQPNPAYAWMELKSGGEAAKLMSELKIRTRCGTRFGVSAKYIRVNMMESDVSFNLFLERLSTIKLE